MFLSLFLPIPSPSRGGAEISLHLSFSQITERRLGVKPPNLELLRRCIFYNSSQVFKSGSSQVRSLGKVNCSDVGHTLALAETKSLLVMFLQLRMWCVWRPCKYMDKFFSGDIRSNRML